MKRRLFTTLSFMGGLSPILFSFASYASDDDDRRERNYRDDDDDDRRERNYRDDDEEQQELVRQFGYGCDFRG